MVPYFLLIMLLLFIFYLFNSRKIDGNQYIIISLMLLFLFSSLRDETMGADSEAYKIAYDAISVTGAYYMEKGYVLLNAVLASIFNSYRAVIVTVNIILFVPLYFFIRETVQKEYYPLAVMIFSLFPYMFIQSTFNLLRQTCAIGFILMAYVLLKNNHKISFILFVVVGFTFHNIALIALIVPILMKLSLKKRTWIIISTVMLGLNFIGAKRIFSVVARAVGYSTYANYPSSALDFKPYVLLIYVFILWLCYNYDSYVGEPDSKGIVNFYLFTLSFLLIAVQNDMAYRVYVIFAYLSLPASSIIIDRASSRLNARLTGLMYVTYYFGFFVAYLISLSNNFAYIPYRLL